MFEVFCSYEQPRSAVTSDLSYNEQVFFLSGQGTIFIGLSFLPFLPFTPSILSRFPCTLANLLSGAMFFTAARLRPKSITPVSQVCNKSVTSWRAQKSIVSVVSCRFPNSIKTTCCKLVADLLATVCRVANKSATSWQLPREREVTGKRV